jgi:hypothetical protein
MPRKLLNQANNLMSTANRTAWNIQSTQRNVQAIGDRNRRKAAQAALNWKCDCGRRNTTNFCDSCGKSKPACPKCGAFPTGSKFCGQCGTPMTAAPAPPTAAQVSPFCGGCGAKLDGAKFCGSCGQQA